MQSLSDDEQMQSDVPVVDSADGHEEKIVDPKGLSE